MTDHDDAADFERFRRKRDPRALGRVFDRLAPELLIVAAHVAPRGVEAEDLVQTAFLDAIEHADRWDASRPLLPWMIGILVHCARNERRRAARSLDHERIARREPQDPAVAAEARELSERFERALRSLPEPYRQLLVLRLAHGLTPIEIAHALGRPHNSVKKQLARGREILRQALPAGIAGAAAVMAGAERGLAQVRGVVLAHAVAVPAMAPGAGLLTGVLVMKKVAIVASAALLAVLVWTLWPTFPAEPIAPAQPHAGLVADSPTEYAPLEPAAREAAADRPVSQRTQATPAFGSVRLQLVWKEDGTPASGIRVFAQPPSPAKPLMRRSDARGTVQIDELAPGRCFFFGVGQGFWTHADIAGGEQAEVHIEVRGGIALRGVVVDAGDVPVAGATICIASAGSHEEVDPRTPCTTDASGKFQCRVELDGYVWARKGGHRPSRATSFQREGRDDLRLTLGGPSHSLGGRVVDAAGNGVAGAFVVVVAEQGSEQPPISQRTDDHGAFEISELAPGRVVVAADARGYAPSRVDVEITDQAPARVHVPLASGAVVHGTVHPAPDQKRWARVAAAPEWTANEGTRDDYYDPRAHGVRHSAFTLRWLFRVEQNVAADGSYRLEHVSPGRIVLTAEAADAVEVRDVADLVDGQRHRWDPRLDDGGSIVGRVLGCDGKPAARWVVAADPIVGGTHRHECTAQDGTFALRGVDAAEYELSVHPPNVNGIAQGPPWARQRVRRGDSGVVLRLAHGVDAAAEITGRVLDENGDPAAGAQVDVRTEADPNRRLAIAEVARDGRFRIGSLPPAVYRVLLSRRGWGRLALGEHGLRAGATKDLGTVRLPARGTARIELRMPDGRAVEPAELRIWSDGNIADNLPGNSEHALARAARGVRISEPLPPGRYELRAFGLDFAPLEHRFELRSGRETLVTLVVEPSPAVRFRVQSKHGDVRGRGALMIEDAAGRKHWNTFLLDPCADFELVRGLAPGSYHFQIYIGPLQQRGTLVVPAAPAQPVVVPVELAPR